MGRRAAAHEAVVGIGLQVENLYARPQGVIPSGRDADDAQRFCYRNDRPWLDA